MRINVLQHVSFEGPAAIAEWALSRRHIVSTTRVDTGDTYPVMDSYDLLVVMGGPMSVNDAPMLPWMQYELQAIETCLSRGKRVLGVCLGSQLLAKVLGAKVYPATQKEIGWFPVRRAPQAALCPWFDGVPAEFTPLHWHGETFDLPAGALRLAETDVCPNQAFSYRKQALGIQFHLEATPASVGSLLTHCGGDLLDAPGVQAAAQIQSAGNYDACRAILFDMLDRLSS